MVLGSVNGWMYLGLGLVGEILLSVHCYMSATRTRLSLIRPMVAS
jgi:hypothetical protein